MKVPFLKQKKVNLPLKVESKNSLSKVLIWDQSSCQMASRKRLNVQLPHGRGNFGKRQKGTSSSTTNTFRSVATTRPMLTIAKTSDRNTTISLHVLKSSEAILGGDEFVFVGLFVHDARGGAVGMHQSAASQGFR